ncbi:hypothetical protein ACE1TF_03415 [Geomicrobium sp. JSM 1781026]|uniref:hypothetical protein n=1 Tax=Geomicrobium sp. JSM 1781026 TaxID=3344580 RepID=UPI0035BF6A73
MKFTVNYIEETIARTEYAPIKRLDKHTLSKERKAELHQVEDIVSFGGEVIYLFDELVHMYEALPSQKKYVNAGVNKMLKYMTDFEPDIEVTTVMVEGCKLRLTRTYMSRLVELHLQAVIREELPNFKHIEYMYVDSVMGVDLVLEDDQKRYYVHVTSNTPQAKAMLKNKESTGGLSVNRTYVPYSRDFDGDLILKYETSQASTSTKFINGFPLFDTDYVA